MPINKLSEENARNSDRIASGGEGGRRNICPALLNLLQSPAARNNGRGGELPLEGAKDADFKATPHAARGLKEP